MVRGFREREAVGDRRLRERAVAGAKEPAETQKPCAGEPWTMLTLASDYRRRRSLAPISQFPPPQDATARAIPSEMTRGNGGRIEGHRFDRRQCRRMPQRDVRRNASIARTAPEAGDPFHVANARITVEERRLGAARRSKACKASISCRCNSISAGVRSMRHPHRVSPATGTGDVQTERRPSRQR